MGVFLQTLFLMYLKIIPEQFGLVKLIFYVKGLAAQLMLPGLPNKFHERRMSVSKKEF